MPNDRVVLIAGYDGIQSLDAVGPAEVFATARNYLGGSGYRLLIASPDGADIPTDSGLRIGADVALAEVSGPVDTLIVAGGLGSFAAAESEPLLADIRAVAARARRVCSVCTGALVLAAAGLLHGRSATTHWLACGELARRHPDVAVDPDRIFVRDGSVYTSAGVTAGMDLALALVEEDHGAALARSVARALVLFLQRPGGQSQFSERLEHPVPAGSVLRPVLDAVVTEPAGEHTLATMAARAAVSERHLARLFTEQTQTTPARYVERIRVEAARDLLEATTLSVDAVATRVGFGSSETLRRAFWRVLGIAPSDYRDRFRKTLPAEPEEMSA